MFSALAKHPTQIDAVEAAKRIGVSRRRVLQFIKSGRLPAQVLGGAYVIQLADLAKVGDRKPGRPKKSKESARRKDAADNRKMR
jgi:excisionase family DNA binding protein